MTEAQKQFEAWFEEYADENDIRLAINYGAYDIAGDAWQHQQQRIETHISINKSLILQRDELQAKLKIAVDALGKILVGYSDKYHVETVATEALKQIEVK